MRGKKQRSFARISWFTVAFWGILLLYDRTGMGFMSLAASAVHEIGHLLAMKACGVRVERITAYPFGLVIERGRQVTSYRTDGLIFAVGIAANALAAVLCGVGMLLFPEYALDEAGAGMLGFLSANVALALVNALPHPVLDGGGILRSFLLQTMMPDRVERIVRLVGECVILPMTCAVLYLLFYGEGNPTVYLLCAYLLWALMRKSS